MVTLFVHCLQHSEILRTIICQESSLCTNSVQNPDNYLSSVSQWLWLNSVVNTFATETFICNPKDLRPRPSFTSASNLIEAYGIIRGRSETQEEVPVVVSKKIPTSAIYYALLRKIVK
eukprot:TRINITY_DN5017_c0_g1_i1.p1 TRINITY_DN5017_c0_g1~~TRINITY_DN5017_c0_g1_i1.p1  ORF type:complete len:118 (-),score=1.16 TRINITY_DN5017_c0_g1_i1:658-1011(-)